MDKTKIMIEQINNEIINLDTTKASVYDLEKLLTKLFDTVNESDILNKDTFIVYLRKIIYIDLKYAYNDKDKSRGLERVINSYKNDYIQL